MKSARVSSVSRSTFSIPSSIAAFLGEEGIVGDHLHLEAERAAGDDRADIARADQPQRLAGDLDAHEPALGPFARLGLFVRLGDLPREREHQCDRVFGGGDRIAERGVHHHHALAAGVGDIDVVHPDPGAADDLEVGRRVEDLLRHLGRAADREPVVFADAGDQLLGGFAGDDVDVAAALLEDLRGVGVHLVGNEDFGLGHFKSPSSQRKLGSLSGKSRRYGTRSQHPLGRRVRQSPRRPSRATGRAPRYRRSRPSRRTRCAGPQGRRGIRPRRTRRRAPRAAWRSP